MQIVLAERCKLLPMSASQFFAEVGQRAPGAHISDITRSIDQEFFPQKYKEQKGVEQSGRDQEQIQDWAEIGWLWENILQYGGWGFRDRMLMRRRAEEPAKGEDLSLQGSYFHSGIHLTPDGLDTSEEPWWLEEYKATRKSIRQMQRTDDPWGAGWDAEPKWVKTFFEWLSRIMGYCHVTTTDRCRLFVYWVCGDWKGSGPQTWRYDIVFTAKEIEENWKMLLNHGLERKIITGEAATQARRGLKKGR